MQIAHEIEPPSSNPWHTSETAAARRRLPPSAVTRRRSRARVRLQPSDQDLTTLISRPPLLAQLPPLAVGSRSNGLD
jgi:hypothetical protein